MYPGIHNYSEIGKLNRVLLHRPGDEIEALVPDNLERLLFDDIPFLRVAQQEHDRFAEILRENGVDVIYYVDETAKALKDPKVKAEFLDLFLNASHPNSIAVKEALFEYLINMDEKKMVSKLIAGVKKDEDLPAHTKSWLTTSPSLIRSIWTQCQTCTLPETLVHVSAMVSTSII